MIPVGQRPVVSSAPRRAHRSRLTRRWALLGCLAVLAAGLALASGWVLPFVGSVLVTEDTPRPVDAIVVLLGSPDRTLEGIELYRAGYARLLVLTKGTPPTGHEELRQSGFRMPEPHELNVRAALTLGVPEHAIALLSERAANTREEAALIEKFVRDQGLHSLIVVTSRSHTRRARLLFGEALDGRVTVAVRPSRFDSFTPQRWWRSPKHRWEVASEYQKLLYYYLVRLAETLRLA